MTRANPPLSPFLSVDSSRNEESGKKMKGKMCISLMNTEPLTYEDTFSWRDRGAFLDIFSSLHHC